MKPAAYMYKLPHHSKWHGIRFTDSVLVEDEPELITEPLYTAHEISEFIRGLYFDDDFSPLNPVFSQIAGRIEKESQK